MHGVAAVGVLVTVSLLASRISIAQSTQPAERIQRQFEALADTDAQVRDEARIALMGISRQDLEALREIVRRSRPLAPSQAVVLHDIVTHVYLAGEPNHGPTNEGFLGVRLAPPRPDGAFLEEQGINTSGLAGVLIEECMPGYSGFRYLRQGDVVLGVKEPVRVRTPQQQELINAVSSVPPNDEIRLEVLRQGRVVEIAMRVSARPLEAADRLLTMELLNQRQAQAEAYWKKHFLPLLEPDVS